MTQPDEQPMIEASAITITPVAVEKVRELLAQESGSSLGLRIFVAGGSCAGLQYGMALDEFQEGDTTVSVDGLNVFIDDMSLGYIAGSEVDYVDSLMGAGFTVKNPNAVSTCGGCSHSFETPGGEDEVRGCEGCH